MVHSILAPPLTNYWLFRYSKHDKSRYRHLSPLSWHITIYKHVSLLSRHIKIETCISLVTTYHPDHYISFSWLEMPFLHIGYHFHLRSNYLKKNKEWKSSVFVLLLIYQIVKTFLYFKTTIYLRKCNNYTRVKFHIYFIKVAYMFKNMWCIKKGISLYYTYFLQLRMIHRSDTLI